MVQPPCSETMHINTRTKFIHSPCIISAMYIVRPIHLWVVFNSFLYSSHCRAGVIVICNSNSNSNYYKFSCNSNSNSNIPFLT